jgi:2-dehydro-3-deoxyphosphogluconate aldolase/(4S)-4-hydroxy-2-oxoglutarate aldolase
MSKFTSAEVLQKINGFPIVPLFYHDDSGWCKQIVKACYDGGARIFEFTNRGPAALEVFKELSSYVHNKLPEMALGIGTVFTAQEAEKFIEAGADVIIQPITHTEVAAVCKKNNLVWIPAAGTLTEIYNAQQLGALVVKLFPGNVYGPGFVKALRGPMPDVKIMVTGGVEPTVESVHEWFAAGANAVGIGSRLFATTGTPTDTLKSITEKLSQLFKSA